jgi:hypothetical protein
LVNVQMAPAHTHKIMVDRTKVKDSRLSVILDQASVVFDDLDFDTRKKFSLETPNHIDCPVEIKKWSDKDKEAELLITLPTEDTILYLYYNRHSPDSSFVSGL